MNFKEVTEGKLTVITCRTMTQFLSLRSHLSDFWKGVGGIVRAEDVLNVEDDISFNFIDGLYDGWCRLSWYKKWRPYSNFVEWKTIPSIIEVDDEN